MDKADKEKLHGSLKKSLIETMFWENQSTGWILRHQHLREHDEEGYRRRVEDAAMAYYQEEHFFRFLIDRMTNNALKAVLDVLEEKE